jgi:hypothetical protein
MIDFYLKQNELTEDPNDYIAVVFQTDVVTEAEMARDISQTVGGVTEGQVAQVIDAYNKRVGAHLEAGRSVKTGLYSTHFSIGGKFSGPDADYNPAINTVNIHVKLNPTLIAAAKRAPKQKHAGIVNGPVIDAVIDLSTGAANATLHPGTNASLVGNRFKIVGPAATNGLAFLDADGDPIDVPMAAISVNNPKTITFIVPNLTPGVYTIRVTTQYSASTKLYDTPRSYTFPGTITIPTP